jgi:hypothetical protein
MYVIIGSHCVPLEGKFLLVALVIIRMTLNVIVCQMPLSVHRSKSCCQTLKHFDNIFTVGGNNIDLLHFIEYLCLISNIHFPYNKMASSYDVHSPPQLDTCDWYII